MSDIDVSGNCVIEFIPYALSVDCAVIIPTEEDLLPFKVHLTSTTIHSFRRTARFTRICVSAILEGNPPPEWCVVSQIEGEDTDGDGALDAHFKLIESKLPPD